MKKEQTKTRWNFGGIHEMDIIGEKTKKYILCSILSTSALEK